MKVHLRNLNSFRMRNVAIPLFNFRPMEFFSNVFTEFTESLNSVTKIFVITVKGLELAIFCVRDQVATTVPARHVWETGSLNWAQFMLQWFIRFPEFAEFNDESSAPFRKTPMWLVYVIVARLTRSKLCPEFITTFQNSLCQILYE